MYYHGVRRKLRVRSTAEDAVTIRCWVRSIAAALGNGGHGPTQDQMRWLASLSDAHHAKLAKWLPIMPWHPTTLAGFLTSAIERARLRLRPSSMLKIQQTQTKLLAAFDGNRQLRTITADNLAALPQR